ncbi:MAG: MBOAT family protein [Planctomycetes bacterium]|nr:MBOAT family protein [Planctomycetota bacterium]
MSFDSVTFWLFFAIAWTVWRFAPFGTAKLITALLSLVFYAWWRIEYVPLILFSAIVDYIVGGRLVQTECLVRRRLLLLVSLVMNLGLLGFFKYTPFVVRTLAPWLKDWGAFPETPTFADWVVPVGISFYTFQTLSYTIDIYRRRIDVAPNFTDFLLYVSFFPQLVAGPIVRAKELLPQFLKRRRLAPEHIQQGFYQIITGLCLKMVVADGVATPVNFLFDEGDAATASVAQTWIGVTSFGVQIYADFAGYSRIAIGLALMMGIRFPETFRYPFISQSLSEFWTRWNIPLSQWLWDYIYVSLGGNRKGAGRLYVNLMITMVLGGLWHGAAWTYFIWGVWHGVGLAIERVLGFNGTKHDRPSGARDWCVRLFRMWFVWSYVATSFVFFRAADFETVWIIQKKMWIAPFTEGLGEWVDYRYMVLWPLVFAPHFLRIFHEWYDVRKGRYSQVMIVAASLLLLTFIRRIQNQAFIYFQF